MQSNWLIATLRRNRLPAALAATTVLGFLMIAVITWSDGVRHYQEFISPRLLRLESGFLSSLQAAENSSGEWRAYYFENAHREVRDILRVARRDRPKGYVARRKHREFIRYYESLDREFMYVDMQSSVNPNLDYVRQFTQKMQELKPRHDDWAHWAVPAGKTNPVS